MDAFVPKEKKEKKKEKWASSRDGWQQQTKQLKKTLEINCQNSEMSKSVEFRIL